MKPQRRSPLTVVALAALGLLALAQGCSDDNNANPKPDTTIPIDTGGKATTSGGESNPSSAGKSNNNGGKGGKGGTGGADANEAGDGPIVDGGGPSVDPQGGEGQGGTGVIEPPACTLPERGANGCFNCPEDKVQVQWLNRCVPGSKCNSFDNATRVPLLQTVAVDPSLPAIP